MTDFSNDAYIVRMAICEEAAILRDMLTAPHILYKPTLEQDGSMWCALFGEDLHSGVAGFGETPEKAMQAFDTAWKTQPTNAAALAAVGAA